MSQEYSRRSFVKTAASAAALAAAPAILGAQGANERINLGWIGTGTRGRYLEERAYAGSAARIKSMSRSTISTRTARSPQRRKPATR